MCIGTNDILINSNKKKIIVIDDPVSSLDNNSLFFISSLIRQLILENKTDKKSFKSENISQVFIFTHNFYFYKEVSFERRILCRDKVHFKVNKINNISSICKQNNKIVFDDYSMLWKTIKDIKSKLKDDSSSNVLIANIMRRIIESYVNFTGLGKTSWDSILSDNENSPDYYIKCAFISMINDESHKASILDSAYYDRLSKENPELLFNVFRDIFKDIGKDHYEMLMGETISDEI